VMRGKRAGSAAKPPRLLVVIIITALAAIGNLSPLL
jgi:hypothetical protein